MGRHSGTRNWVLGSWLAVVLFACAADAQAATDAERAKARALLVEGSGLIDTREYARALTKFQTAYDLVPSPRIHYNFGLAYRGLGRAADALIAFRRFIVEAKDAPGAHLTAAREFVAELESQVAIVTIEGDAAVTDIAVDGRPVPDAVWPHVPLDPGRTSSPPRRRTCLRSCGGSASPPANARRSWCGSRRPP